MKIQKLLLGALLSAGFVSAGICDNHEGAAAPGASSSAMPAGCPKAFKGFYAGIQAGGAFGLVRTTGHYSFSNRDDHEKSALWKESGLIGAMLGWGGFLHKLFVGLEGAFSFKDLKGVTEARPLQQLYTYYQVRMCEQFDLHARFGLRATDTLLGYMRMGVSWSKYKAIAENTQVQDAYVSRKGWRPGFAIGFGMENKLSVESKWSWGFEGRYVAYRSIRIDNSQTAGLYQLHPRNASFALNIKRFF
jgi:opacity protein-like surface antigen